MANNIRNSKYYKNMNSYTATGLAEGFVEPTAKTDKGKKLEILSAWQYLVDTGQCWSLQGWFGRTANALLENGDILPPKKKTQKNSVDYYGNKINFERYKK